MFTDIYNKYKNLDKKNPDEAQTIDLFLKS